jgi:subtilase family serine protease
MHRFLRPVALLALPVLLAACGSHGTSSALPQLSGVSAPNGAPGGAFGQLVQRSMDPNIRANCGAVVEGYARCFSFVRTDVGGNASPNVGGYGPVDLISAYNLPSATKGSHQTVGIVDAFDDPTAESDLAIYRSHFGLSTCSTANHCFRKVNQHGFRGHYPQGNSGWAQEISLDVDMVSAICPNCHILLVEGDDNSFHSLALSVSEAARLGADAISNSYGGGESGGAGNNYSYHHPGHMITASTGDSGFGPQFPAGSQWVTAVGGTTLNRGGGTRGWTETVWSGAGSGCSSVFPKPSWQKDTGCAMRTISDVSADANPGTGVAVVYNGNFFVFGGTSVSSPIIASVYALGANAYKLNFAQHGYNNTGSLFDVTSGSNGHCSPAYLCTGEPGYDGPTGNGTPNGVGAF